MPETRPPIDLKGVSLAELQKLIDERALPPVDQWNPDRCGDSGDEQWRRTVEDVDHRLELAGVVQHVAVCMQWIAAGKQ